MPTKWSAGKADEAWKVMICARDASRAEDLIQGMAYILGPKHRSIDEAADFLRQFSGDQIADALLAYRDKAHESVMNAIGD